MYQCIDRKYFLVSVTPFTFTETPKHHLMNLLISKRLALERKEKSKIDIVPLLSSIPEESWSPVDESRYTLYRHLILRAPSYDLHSIFHCVAANALQNFTRVSLGRYYLVIHNDHFQCRIDCGPCIVNASVAEIRIIVRANSREKCKSVTQEMESFLQTCYGTLGLSSEVNFKASCSICRQCYIDLADIQEVSMRGDEDHVSCKRCYRNIPVGDLLNGFNEMRDVLEMNWRPFHGLQVTGLLSKASIFQGFSVSTARFTYFCHVLVSGFLSYSYVKFHERPLVGCFEIDMFSLDARSLKLSTNCACASHDRFLIRPKRIT